MKLSNSDSGDNQTSSFDRSCIEEKHRKSGKRKIQKKGKGKTNSKERKKKNKFKRKEKKCRTKQNKGTNINKFLTEFE